MKHPTAKTSVKQIPAAYTEPELASVYRGAKNLDYGGGRFEDATEYLWLKHSCLNLVYDPHCRTAAHNIDVIRNLDFDGSIRVISCLNVLNVLLEKNDRDQVLEAIKYLADSYPTVEQLVFQVYTKDSTDTPSASQLNKKPEWYFQEIEAAFNGWHIKVLGNKKNIFLLTRSP